MRIWAVFKKSVRQQLRDRLGFLLTVLTAPFFVLLYGIFFAGEPGAAPGAARPFDAYVPGLLVFSVIMLVFSAAMSVAREVEYGAILRLKLTPLSTLELLAGSSTVQLLLGAISVALTMLTAEALGFESHGKSAVILLLALIACLSSIGVGMVVASLSRSTTRAFLIASVAMFLLMLFSGVIFPRPRAEVFEVGGRSIGLFDALPTTHLSVGLEKLLQGAATSSDLSVEVSSLLALSALYFLAGAIAFQRRHRLSGGAGP